MFDETLNYAPGATVMVVVDKTTRAAVRYIWVETAFTEVAAQLDATLFETFIFERASLLPNKNILVSAGGVLSFTDPIPVSTDPAFGAS
jgi:hypothetical protein